MKLINEIDILGYEVFVGEKSVIIESVFDSNYPKIVNTINPHSYVEAKSDSEFRNALLNSDLLIPDGSGIVLAAKIIHNKNIAKISGFDFFYSVMKHLNMSNGKVLFLGSTECVLKKIAERSCSEFPNVECNVLSPPFKLEFSDDDIKSFIQTINVIKPDVVFVGLTAPKQEKLIQRMRDSVDVKILSGIGAVFDFYGGTVKRPSKIWLRLHLEWLVRLIGEPKRLWRRTFISAPKFLFDVLRKRNLR